MQISCHQIMETGIEIDLTCEEEKAISEAATMAGLTRDQLAQQALKLLLRDIRTGAAEKEYVA